MSDELERRLATLAEGDASPPASVASLRTRVTKRRRRRLAGLGLSTAVLLGAGVAVWQPGSSGGTDVRTVDRPDGGVVVPDVVGLFVPEAGVRLEAAGLEWSVHDEDAADWSATVLVQEPPGGATVPGGSPVGMRTVLPAPPAGVVCPGFPTGDLPGGVDAADARPNVEAVALQYVRSTVDGHRAEWAPGDAFVARGVVRPWKRSSGDVVLEEEPGYQVVVRVERRDQCPSWPATAVNGTWSTYTVEWPSYVVLRLGMGQVWPLEGTGGPDPSSTARAFAAAVLGVVADVEPDESAPPSGPVWVDVRAGALETRILLAPIGETGWAVLQVGEPGLVYTPNAVRFPVPDAGVSSGWLVARVGDKTNRYELGRSELDTGMVATGPGPSTAVLVLFDEAGRAVHASGGHT